MQKDHNTTTDQQPHDEMLRKLWNEDVAKMPDTELRQALDTFRENRDMLERPRLRKLRVVRLMKYAALFILPVLAAWAAWNCSAKYNAEGNEIAQFYVPNGRIDSLMLSDSTKVIVNAGSSIVYPSTFSKRETCRNVFVNGSCHFAVTHDASRPFVVNMGNLKVKVLGTHFSVNSYNDEEKVTVTLEEGLVKVFDDSHSMILHPNEQLTYNQIDGKMTKSRIDALAFNSWVNGDLNFSNQPLSEMLKTIERRYNVKINVASGIDMNKRYTMNFKKGEHIGNVMTVLTVVAGNMSYKKQHNNITLYVKKGG